MGSRPSRQDVMGPEGPEVRPCCARPPPRDAGAIPARARLEFIYAVLEMSALCRLVCCWMGPALDGLQVPDVLGAYV